MADLGLLVQPPRWIFAGVLAASIGCQNNTIELEDDASTGDGSADGGTATSTTTTTTTTTTNGDVADVDVGDDTSSPGTTMLLLAISTPLDPGLPVQGYMVVNGVGGAALDFTIQWLSLDRGSTTTPRELVGDVYAYPAVPVNPDGTFYLDMGVVLIPGAANPITGEDLVTSIQLSGMAAGDPYCGPVGGQVIMPVEFPLDGSNFGTTQIFDVLPIDFLVSC